MSPSIRISRLLIITSLSMPSYISLCFCWFHFSKSAMSIIYFSENITSPRSNNVLDTKYNSNAGIPNFNTFYILSRLASYSDSL